MKHLLLLLLVISSLGLKPENSTQLVVKNSVTDSAVSGVNIKLWKADKVIWTGVTNENGISTTDKIIADNYHLEFQKEGFKAIVEFPINNKEKAENVYRIEISMTPKHITREQKKKLHDKKKAFKEKLKKAKN